MDLERIVKQSNLEIFTPLEAAERQIDRAIILFLEDHDYICAITLACAADGILGDALRVQNKTAMIDLLKSELQRFDLLSHLSPKQISDQHLNKIRNLLKHLSGDLNETINHVTDIEAIIAIIRAAGNFIFITERPTKKTVEFFEWLQREHPAIFEEAAKYGQSRLVK